MPHPFELPSWLQFVVAACSIISSLGVIVALVQISITKNQFKTQLGVTTAQFTLLNQGYINLDTRSILSSPQLAGNSTLRPGIKYESIAIEAIIENVGNTPIVYKLESCKIYFKGVEVYEFPTDGLGSSVSYPKQKSMFGLGRAFFTSTHQMLSPSEIQALKMTCKFKFDYHDFNSNHIKSIDRTLVIGVDDYTTTGQYIDIKDKL